MNIRAFVLIVFVCFIFVSVIDAQRKKGKSNRKGKKDPCHLKEVEVCIGKVQALGKRKEPSVLITSDDGLNTICKAIRDDLSRCVKAFVKKCGTPLHREVVDLVVDQITTSTSRFCNENNDDRKKFLKESPCIHKKVLSQDLYKSTCNNNFLATVDQIDTSNHTDADVTHATICCGYNKWDSCTKKIITKECGKDAFEIFSEFVGDAFGTITKMMCPQNLFSTRKDICKDLLPNETIKAKGKLGDNALTKYVVSLFSFLFVFDE